MIKQAPFMSSQMGCAVHTETASVCGCAGRGGHNVQSSLHTGIRALNPSKLGLTNEEAPYSRII